MSSAANPCADTIARDSSFPLAKDFLGCNPSRVRSHSLLKCSDQLDRTAPTGPEGNGTAQSSSPYSSLRELVSLPTERGWKLCCQTFPFCNRAKRGSGGRSSSSRACQKARSTEKLGNGCPLLLQVLDYSSNGRISMGRHKT